MFDGIVPFTGQGMDAAIRQRNAMLPLDTLPGRQAAQFMLIRDMQRIGHTAWDYQNYSQAPDFRNDRIGPWLARQNPAPSLGNVVLNVSSSPTIKGL